MILIRFPMKRLGLAASEILLLLMVASGRTGSAASLTLKVIPEPERAIPERSSPERYVLRIVLECHREVPPASLQWTLEYSTSNVTITEASMSAAAQQVAKNVYCRNSGGQSTCLLFGLNHESLACGHLATLKLRLDPKTADPVQFRITGAAASSSDGSARPLKANHRAIALVP